MRLCCFLFFKVLELAVLVGFPPLLTLAQGPHLHIHVHLHPVQMQTHTRGGGGGGVGVGRIFFYYCILSMKEHVLFHKQ